MKTFEFRFESILRYRRHRRDTILGRMKTALDQREHMAAELRNLEQTRMRELRNAQQSSQPGQIDARALADSHRYLQTLARQVLDAQQHLHAAQRDIDELRDAVKLADQAVRSLEIMREKEQQRWLVRRNELEQQDSDEVWGQLNQNSR